MQESCSENKEIRLVDKGFAEPELFSQLTLTILTRLQRRRRWVGSLLSIYSLSAIFCPFLPSILGMEYKTMGVGGSALLNISWPGESDRKQAVEGQTMEWE